MSELIFTAPGQADVLAAQEAVARKGREVKRELEEGAKATKSWTTEMGALQRGAESALKSVQTEQEKIAQQIAAIQEAEEKGLVSKQDSERAVMMLRQRWIEVDAATAAAKQREEEFTAAQDELKAKAESALGSVKTELEDIEDQIADIEAAAKAGLIPPAEAEEGVKRLKERMNELKDTVGDADAGDGRLAAIVKKAFDPAILVKFGATLFGIKALMSQLRAEFDDFQTAIDKRIEAQQTVGEKATGAVFMGLAGQVLGGPAGLAVPQATDRQFQDFGRYNRRRQVRGTLDQGFEDLARLGDSSQLTSEELEKLADILREHGHGALARKIGTFIKQIDDGTVSIEEVAAQLRLIAKGIGARRAYAGESEGGPVYTFMDQPTSALNPRDQEIRGIFERMASALEKIEQNQQNGGLGVDGG